MSNIDGPQHIREETYVDPLTPAAPAVAVQPMVQPVNQPMVVADPLQGGQVAYVQQAPVAVAQAPMAAVQTSASRRFSPDAVIAALVGLALLIVGLLAIVRGGFDGPMDDPVVEVLGFTHTTTLGLIEIGLGVCLLICGAATSRSGALFFGTVMGVAGVVGAVQSESFEDDLALEPAHAWWMVAAAVLVVVTALLLPRFVSRSTSVQAMQ